jgi:hypothetical protein
MRRFCIGGMARHLACGFLMTGRMGFMAMQSADMIASLAMAMSTPAASTLSAGSASRSMSRKRYKAFIPGTIAPFGRAGESLISPACG